MARGQALIDRYPERAAPCSFRARPGSESRRCFNGSAEHAAERGIETLATEGVEAEAELAFAGLQQLLWPIRGHIEELPAPRGALEAAFGINELDVPDPFLVALAAYELITSAASSAAMLLVVDDAHWLDRSTLGVLTFISRRLARESVALVAAVRDGYSTPLGEARLPTLRLSAWMPGRRATARPSRPSLHPVARARVFAEASGNPLALIELGRALPTFPAVGRGAAVLVDDTDRAAGAGVLRATAGTG